MGPGRQAGARLRSRGSPTSSACREGWGGDSGWPPVLASGRPAVHDCRWPCPPRGPSFWASVHPGCARQALEAGEAEGPRRSRGCGDTLGGSALGASGAPRAGSGVLQGVGGTPGHCGHLMLHPGWTQAPCQPGPPVHGHLGLVTYGDDTSSRCTVDHSSYVGSLHGRSFHNSGRHPRPEGARQSSTPGSCLLPHAIWDPRDFQAWGLLGCTQKSPGKFWKHRGQSQEGHQGPPRMHWRPWSRLSRPHRRFQAHVATPGLSPEPLPTVPGPRLSLTGFRVFPCPHQRPLCHPSPSWTLCPPRPALAPTSRPPSILQHACVSPWNGLPLQPPLGLTPSGPPTSALAPAD